MDFDQLMQFIGADEELGRMYHYGCDCVIDVRTIDGKNVLNIHCYSINLDNYEMIIEFLNFYGVKYRHCDNLELRSGKITVDVETTCTFCVDDFFGGEPDSVANIEGKYIKLADDWVDLEITRKEGQKKLEVIFFLETEGYSIVEPFFNSNSVSLSKSYYEVFGELLTVQLDVKCYFLPMKDEGG